MSNHYFIGVSVPKEAAFHLNAERKKWKLRSYKLVVPPADMHITLVYIGADPHRELESVHDALQQIEQNAFDVTVKGAGTFGSRSTPRVLFGALEESEDLNRLQQKVFQALAPFQLRPDDRKFVPHVTLAKKWAGGPPLPAELPLQPIAFPVTAFSIFKVNLDRQPRYEAVYTYKLKRGDLDGSADQTS